MAFEDLAELSRRDRVRVAVLVAALVFAVLWAWWHFLQPGPPRYIVLASGPEGGVYHRYALRYQEILGREGVAVQVRMTGGAGENLALLLDAKSGVDVAFMQGGVASSLQSGGLVMLASLYYEPLWVFYRDAATVTRLNQLHGKHLAVGIAGSGTRALALRLLSENGLTDENGIARDKTDLRPIGGGDALRALRAGEIDAAFYVGGADTPVIQQALHDPSIKLMNMSRADAAARRFAYLTKLTLPSGTVDMALDIPNQDIAMIGTKAMLVARESLHPAIIDLLVDAAREIHGQQGYFETAGEFPGTTPVDIPISPAADEHRRFGPSFLHRYFPFWLATVVERAVILLVPLVVVFIPLLNFLPQLMRWRVRSRIYRWYGELTLLERDVATRQGPLPLAKWSQDLDRIEHAVEDIRTPASFASEAYTLREHVALVRRTVRAKTGATTSTDPAGETVRPETSV